MIRAGGRWAHQFHGVRAAVSQARLRLARPAADLDVLTDLYELRNPLDPRQFRLQVGGNLGYRATNRLHTGGYGALYIREGASGGRSPWAACA